MKNDYAKVSEKLVEVGAELHDSTDNATDEVEADMQIDFWDVHGVGLVVLGYQDGSCGLYTFVGNNGDSVEKDLSFIEELADRAIEVNAKQDEILESEAIG